MQDKIQSKYLAYSTLVLLGCAASGCSTSGSQTVQTIEPEPTQYTGHVIYEDTQPKMFSLVATDHVGFLAFADTMVAWSIQEPYATEHDSLVAVESH